MKYLTRLIRFFSSLRRPHPSRDWFYALMIAGIFLLSSTLFASYLFFGIESGTITTPLYPSSVPSAAVTRGDIQRVLESYRARKINYESKNFPKPVLKDPAVDH